MVNNQARQISVFAIREEQNYDLAMSNRMRIQDQMMKQYPKK